MEKDQEILTVILEAIVSEPAEVRIARVVDDMGVLLRVWVAREDMGVLIGERGVNINAIKLVMKNIGRRQKSHIAVKVEEPLITL